MSSPHPDCRQDNHPQLPYCQKCAEVPPLTKSKLLFLISSDGKLPPIPQGFYSEPVMEDSYDPHMDDYHQWSDDSDDSDDI